jgi:hypothetical protein
VLGFVAVAGLPSSGGLASVAGRSVIGRVAVSAGEVPGSTWMVTPSLPLAPLATTSITRRTEFPAPTTGLAGRTLISRMASSLAAEDAGMGTVSAPAASETRRRLLVMIETVGTIR